MPVFRHTHQLVQLKRLDLQAHNKAARLYGSGRWAMAGKIIVEAMQLALSRLSKAESNGDSGCEICGKATDLIQELCPECYNGTQEPQTPEELENIPPPPGCILYDLVIASKKYGYGSTTNANSPILWWKLAGEAKEDVYAQKYTLINPVIQQKLLDYELIKTEVHSCQIIRKYRLIGDNNK